MISILMNIESAKHVRDINLKDDVGDIIVKFSCETPLNEMDTCDMFTFHFGNIYYEVSDEDYFIRKGPLSEMGGNMRLEVSEKNLCLKPVILYLYLLLVILRMKLKREYIILIMTQV